MPDTMASTSPDCVSESSVMYWEAGVIISIRGRQTELQQDYLISLNGGAGDSSILCQTSASFRNILYLWLCSIEWLFTHWKVAI